MQQTVTPQPKKKIYRRKHPFTVTRKNWKPLYTRILLLAEQGQPSRLIAEKVSVTVDTVKRVMKSEYFVQKLMAAKERVLDRVTEKAATRAAHRHLVDKAREVLESASKQAADRMKRALKKPETLTRIQFEICKDILDRVGLKPKEVIETHERVYPPEETESALLTAQEVEGVLERLSNQNSRFILTRQLPDDRSPVTDASPGPTALTEASPPRQETESA